MCGRYSLTRRQQEISERFGLDQILGEFAPRFNISPTQNVPVILQVDGKKTMEAFQWGLVPSWVKDLKAAKPMINARSETLIEKPSFKSSLIKRRCLVPADGFYEWKTSGKSKTPMFIHCTDDRLFAFAGIYAERKNEDGTKMRSFSIITCAANDTVSPVHDRMPVILPPELESRWLDPELQDPTELVQILNPFPNELITMHQVSRDVNSAKTDAAHMVEPIDAETAAVEEAADAEARSTKPRKKKEQSGPYDAGVQLGLFN